MKNPDRELHQQRGINRNILECKFGCAIACPMTCSVLIETYWNVNDGEDPMVCVLLTSINRNILECKFPHRAEKGFQNLCINRNILECKCFRITE